LLATSGEIDKVAYQFDVAPDLSAEPVARVLNRHRFTALIADPDGHAETSDIAGCAAYMAEHDDRRSAENLQCEAQLRTSTARKAPIGRRFRMRTGFLILVRRPKLDRERRQRDTSDGCDDR
jgi:hypothetical protein